MRPERYNVRESEAKWRKAWADAGVFKTLNADPRPKYYVLEMFPYPSGRIHMGHVRNYAMGDVVARFRRARGFNVLHPMGWDAFGMPAENAAMKNNTHPATWTYANIDAMRAQLQSMGLSLDWSREIATCDPSYYRHQQKLFLDFLAAGLVARKKSKVNWDPVDHTVLANEQVIDGRGWRSGAVVEQRELTQWFLKITDYSEDLLASLDRLDRWPEKVRLMQRNWIGRSEGLMVRFVIDPATRRRARGRARDERTRDLYDAARHAVRREVHGDRARSSARRPPPRGTIRSSPAFIEECRRIGTSVAAIETAEKKGYDTGLRVVHPFDPELAPAGLCRQFHPDGLRHGRDLRLPRARPARPRLRQRLRPRRDAGRLPARTSIPRPSRSTTVAYDGDGLMINSRFLDGMTIEAAKEEVARRLEAVTIGNRPQAKRQVNFKLRDWGISRQRYWGCPIPVIHCEDCGVVPVPAKDLPVRLPDDVTFDQPGNPLDRHPTWKHVACPQCGRPGAARDRHDGHVRQFVLVFRPLHRSRPTRRRRPTRRSPTTGCRSTSTSAASSTRSCICSIRASSPARCASAAISTSTSRSPGLFTQGMVVHETYRDARGQWVAPSEVRIDADGGARRAVLDRHAASRSRSARSRRCRSRSATRSTPTRSSRPTAPTRRAGSCCRIRRPSAT